MSVDETTGVKSNQQELVYRAEESLSADWGAFASLAEVRAFVLRARGERWWDTAVRPRVQQVIVTRSDSLSCAMYDEPRKRGVISIARHDLCERVVVHELAHVVAGAVHGSGSHDPWFTRCYLELASLLVGPVAYATLATAFEYERVQVAREGFMYLLGSEGGVIGLTH